MVREFITKSISFSPEVLKTVDRKRKSVPRSRWINQALEELLNIPENRRGKYE